MTSISRSDRSRSRDRFVKSVKVKLTDEAYSQLEKRYNKDLNEIEKFLTELNLSYSSEDRTLKGPLHALKEVMSKVMEEVNENENKKKKSKNKEEKKDGRAQVHGDVDDEGDEATAPKTESMSRNNEQVNMEVDHRDGENAAAEKEVMNKSWEMVSGSVKDDDDGDDHMNEKVNVPQKKVSEKEKKDSDNDDDDDDVDENLKDDKSVDDLSKSSASGDTREIEKSNFPIQSGSGDSGCSQKSRNSEEQEKHRPGDGRKDGDVSQSDTQSQTFDQTASHHLDQPSTQTENSENFPNSSNELEGFEPRQSIHEIQTYKSQASDKMSSLDDLLSQEPYFTSGASHSSLNATGRRQRDPEVNVLLGIKNQPEADNVPATQSQKKSDSSTDPDFEKTEESDDSSGESISKNNVGGSAKKTHSVQKISNSTKISKKTLKSHLKGDGKANPTPNKDEILKKINQQIENQLGNSDLKDVANNSGLAGVHQGHASRVRSNPVSERINLSSGSSTGNNMISVRDLCSEVNDEAEKGWQAPTSERRMDQSHKSVEDTSNGSSYAQGSSSGKGRHGSQSESKCKMEANSLPHVCVFESETFTIQNVNCDVDLLKDLITAENKWGHIKIDLKQDEGDIVCTISGGSEEEMQKTKQWLLDFIEANIHDNDASSRSEIQFIQNSKSAFEEKLRLQQNVLCFAAKYGDGCFIALRWFLSKLEGSYLRLHFNHRTKEIIIIFSDNEDKMDAVKRKFLYDNDIKMSVYPFLDKMSQNIVAKVSSRMPDVFVEFNDDKNYFIIGNNRKFVDECLKPPSKNKKFSLLRSNMDTPKFVTLKVEIANKELSKADACRFVIFGDLDKNISLINFGFKDWTRISSIEKISQDVELVTIQDPNKKIYLVRTPTHFHSAHHGREEKLRDLYSTALYHASDGAASLAMTLTKTVDCGLDVSVAILHEVIRNYDLGKRVHDKLKTLTIVTKNQSHYKKLKGYSN